MEFRIVVAICVTAVLIVAMITECIKTCVAARALGIRRKESLGAWRNPLGKLENLRPGEYVVTMDGNTTQNQSAQTEKNQ